MEAVDLREKCDSDERGGIQHDTGPKAPDSEADRPRVSNRLENVRFLRGEWKAYVIKIRPSNHAQASCFSSGLRTRIVPLGHCG